MVFSAEEYRAGRALFRGPGPMLQAIVKYEGPAAMFRGLLPTLLREVPGNAGACSFAERCGAGVGGSKTRHHSCSSITTQRWWQHVSPVPPLTCPLPLPPPLSQHAAYFGTYEALKHALAAHQGIPVTQLSSLSLMTAGGIGGAAFWVAVYPMDVRRGQTAVERAAALAPCSKQAAAGCGMVAQLCGSFHCCKCGPYLTSHCNARPHHPPTHSCMQVIKSRIQTQSAFAADRYRGVLDCGVRLYRSGGWASLWRGFGPCFARSIPANSAAFLVYERVKAALT